MTTQWTFETTPYFNAATQSDTLSYSDHPVYGIGSELFFADQRKAGR